uniref:Uncharacterized protein n=1 Tax=Anopheles dirus TaxID=7168 RepID=A0A182NQF2_9DIPT
MMAWWQLRLLADGVDWPGQRNEANITSLNDSHSNSSDSPLDSPASQHQPQQSHQQQHQQLHLHTGKTPSVQQVNELSSKTNHQLFQLRPSHRDSPWYCHQRGFDIICMASNTARCFPLLVLATISQTASR